MSKSQMGEISYNCDDINDTASSSKTIKCKNRNKSNMCNNSDVYDSSKKYFDFVLFKVN